MKIYSKILSVAFTVMVVASSVQAQETETRKLGHFAKVHSGGSWEAVLEEGNTAEVRIEAKGVDLSKVKTEIDGNTLELGLVKGNYKNVELKFYVVYTTLEEVGCSGSGEMLVKSDVKAGSFKIGVSGSGSITMQDLRADELNASISGSAEIKIGGGVIGEAEINQSGSGDFVAEDLAIDNLKVSKSGSGDTHVGELGEVSVQASGSGDVIYSGSPRMGNIQVSGSSSIRKR